MGLDIIIRTDRNEEIFTTDYHDVYFSRHGLSRTFCNFMCRQNVINGVPELDQIGEITSVDISPIYQMETYGSETGEELEFFLEMAESEDERNRIREQAQQNRDNLKGNIDKVLLTVNSLIDKLRLIDNLPSCWMTRDMIHLIIKVTLRILGLTKAMVILETTSGRI